MLRAGRYTGRLHQVEFNMQSGETAKGRMASSTHHGDEDPECSEADADSPEEHELFETMRFMGWTPEVLEDRAFAGNKEWLARQPTGENSRSR